MQKKRRKVMTGEEEKGHDEGRGDQREGKNGWEKQCNRRG